MTSAFQAEPGTFLGWTTFDESTAEIVVHQLVVVGWLHNSGRYAIPLPATVAPAGVRLAVLHANGLVTDLSDSRGFGNLAAWRAHMLELHRLGKAGPTEPTVKTEAASEPVRQITANPEDRREPAGEAEILLDDFPTRQPMGPVEPLPGEEMVAPPRNHEPPTPVTVTEPAPETPTATRRRRSRAEIEEDARIQAEIEDLI